jgi:cytochrome c peroxidase
MGALPQFTDFGFNALGVPRNPAIPANTKGDYYDLGLCGPERRDFADHKEYCGLFRTPSLRNVALRRTFFHNGRFHTLREVLEF